MPTSVYLDFTPPDREDLTKLHIFESDDAAGPWVLVETVTDIGTYPDYISSYTTNLATSNIKWFSIQWEDSKGAKTDLSNPIQGGTETLVGEIVKRALERDGSLDEQVVLAETEALLEAYFRTDPYTVDPSSVGYRIKNALAKVVHAKTLYTSILVSSTGTSSTSGWTAGLVSMKSGSESTTKNVRDIIDYLLKEASRELGIGVSIVAQMAEITIAGGFSQVVSADISRLQIEVE